MATVVCASTVSVTGCVAGRLMTRWLFASTVSARAMDAVGNVNAPGSGKCVSVIGASVADAFVGSVMSSLARDAVEGIGGKVGRLNEPGAGAVGTTVGRSAGAFDGGRTASASSAAMAKVSDIVGTDDGAGDAASAEISRATSANTVPGWRSSSSSSSTCGMPGCVPGVAPSS
jgi:hypothetical protein